MILIEEMDDDFMDFVLGKEGKKDIRLSEKVLVKHLLAFGGSGSGKTVLLKGMIEEAAIQGVPSLVIDLQGDLSSLSHSGGVEEVVGKGRDRKDAERYQGVSVKIYTPGSSIGIPVSVNPLFTPDSKEEAESFLGSMVSSLLGLLGYTLGSDSERMASALLYLCLKDSWKKEKKIEDLSVLLDSLVQRAEYLKEQSLCSDDEFKKLIKKINTATIGSSNKILTYGLPLRIEEFMKKGQISVMYLNHLSDQREKDFFISTLTLRLYHWMLHHPSQGLQLLFCVDEIAPYLPAGTKMTLAKSPLQLMFKQARKYGVGCMVATQNPGDIDYRSFAQFSTWCLGRLTAKQDRKKVEEGLESFGKSVDADRLASISQGNFLLFSPDEYDRVVEFSTRWLLSEHKTLTEKEIKELMKDEQPKIPVVERKEKRVIARGVKSSKERKVFALRLKDDEVEELVESKRKRVGLLSSKREEVVGIKKNLVPLVKLHVREVQKKLLGFSKETKEYDVLISLRDGEIFIHKNGKMKALKGFKLLLEVDDEDIAVVRVLGKGWMEENKLQKKVEYSLERLRKRLSRLQRKEFVEKEKKEKEIFWKRVYSPDLPSKLEALHSQDLVLTTGGEGEVLQKIMDESSLIGSLCAWYEGCSVESHEVIYLPVFEVVLQGKQKRILRFNGYSREEIY